MGQFLGGLAVAFGAVVGGVIAWRKLGHERKQEDLRIVRPTMEEVEKYGQPARDKSDKAKRKTGSLLMLIIGAVYIYMLVEHAHGAGVPVGRMLAAIFITGASFLALVQGTFQLFGVMGSLQRMVLTLAGIAGIGTGTYTGASVVVAARESERAKTERRVEIKFHVVPVQVEAFPALGMCRQPSDECIGLLLEHGKDSLFLYLDTIPLDWADPSRPVKEVELWMRGEGSSQTVRVGVCCYYSEPDSEAVRVGMPVWSERTELSDAWEKVIIRVPSNGCVLRWPGLLGLSVERTDTVKSRRVFLDGGTLVY